MKFKSIIMFGIGLSFLTSNIIKPLAISFEVQNVKENITHNVKRLASITSDEETEDPYEILSRAIESYKDQFDDYIDITGLNVLDKEDINLPNYNPNYVAPTFGEVMYNYQYDLEQSLTPVSLNKYEQLRMTDYNFDRYVALNSNKYQDLDVAPKYEHIIPLEAITMTLVVILTNAGLSEGAISAFTAAVATLSGTVSTSWIPFIGWVLAAALAVGALIAITTVIVQNWDGIRAHIDEIKNWFIEQFNSFKSLIIEFFADAVAAGEESTIAERQVIDGEEIIWKDAHMNRDVVISIATDLKLNKNDVLLMKKISTRANEMRCWVATAYVSTDFVINHKLCDSPYFFSTYTWYNNTAKRMLYESCPSYSNYGGYGYKNLVYHRFTEMKRAVYGWNHYHIGMYNSISKVAETYDEEASIHAVHSFFGLTYIRLGDNEGFVSLPAM